MKPHRFRRVSAAVVATGLAGVALTACGGHSSKGAAQNAANSLAAATAGGGGGAGGGDTAGAGTTQGGATAPGNDGGGGGGGATVNVCSLLSAAQASAIVGVTYTSAQTINNMCSYTPGTAPEGLFIIVTSTDTESWSQAMSQLAEDGGASPSPASGVGDKAAGSGTQFNVLSGKWIIDVHGGDPLGQSGDFSKSAQLAKAVIAGLH